MRLFPHIMRLRRRNHEIDFHYDEAMITADNLMTFKDGCQDNRKTTRSARDIYAKAEE